LRIAALVPFWAIAGYRTRDASRALILMMPAKEAGLGILGWKRGEFKVRRHPLTQAVFDHWISRGGKPALREALRNTRQRWFFGGTRARQRLYAQARIVFRPRSTFSEAMKKRADELPGVIRACAIGIRKGVFGHMSTFDDNNCLCVVPRAIIQSDFRARMLRELSPLPQVHAFRGLTEEIIAAAAMDAEASLFQYLARRAPLVESAGHGLIVEVDAEFPWKLGGSEGHYVFAWSVDERLDLTNRRDRRRFLSAIAEMRDAQSVYLKRMTPSDIGDLRTAIDLRRLAGGRLREHSAHAKVRIVAEEPEHVFSETS
jgi:hypothetical protein